MIVNDEITDFLKQSKPFSGGVNGHRERLDFFADHPDLSSFVGDNAAHGVQLYRDNRGWL